MKKLLTALRLISIAAMFTATAQAQVAQPGRAGWQADKRANCKVWNPIPQAGETVEWSGTCTNGYADGGGQLTWKFATGNEVWTVNMAAGKSGTGPYKIVTTHNGTTSTWTGTFTNGIKTGVNVRTFADGNQFEGNWTNGQANGPSVYTTKDGERQSVFAANGCIWSAEVGGTFINSVDKNKNQCLSERGTSPIAADTGSAITECHALASSPADPQRKAQGVPYAKINAPKAIAACRLATQQASGDGQLWFEYGRALERGNLLPDSITAYQTGINLNNAGAMNNLGELYLDGKGTQKNLATAESLFKRAAAMGFPEAQENLARLLSSVNTQSASTPKQNNTTVNVDSQMASATTAEALNTAAARSLFDDSNSYWVDSKKLNFLPNNTQLPIRCGQLMPLQPNGPDGMVNFVQQLPNGRRMQTRIPTHATWWWENPSPAVRETAKKANSLDILMPYISITTTGQQLTEKVAKQGSGEIFTVSYLYDVKGNIRYKTSSDGPDSFAAVWLDKDAIQKAKAQGLAGAKEVRCIGPI